MTTFAQDIRDKAGSEVIEGVVIGTFGWGSDNEPDDEAYGWDRSVRVPVPAELKHRVLSWAEAEPYLQYEYEDGFGSPDCHAITAWTATKVIFVGTYDGSTWVHSVPRNPVDHNPGMVGGG